MKAVNSKLIFFISINDSKENSSLFHWQWVISIADIAYIDMYVYIYMLLRAIVPSIGSCLVGGPMIAKMVCNSIGTISSAIFYHVSLVKTIR